MKLAFLSNYFNHHQKPISDEFYRLLRDGNYFFVETADVPEFRKALGYQEMTAPYVLKYGDKTKEKVKEIISEFDVVVFSGAPLSLVKRRYKEGKMTFCYSERRFKSKINYLFYPIYAYRSLYINKGYLLCAGAFSSSDYHIFGLPISRCFKWGYFPEVRSYGNIDTIIENKQSYKSKKINILWAGRLIGWKHPETAIKLAIKLKSDNIPFSLDIIGAGELEGQIRTLVADNNLIDHVHLLGSMKPEEVRTIMERSDIFLFTSNRREGWGAVLNESMNSACAVVVRDVIGSAPFLVQDGANGMIFHNDLEMYEKVKFLIDHPSERKGIQISAYNSIQQMWNAKCAVHNFIELVEVLKRGELTTIKDGPCSQAPLMTPFLRR